MDEAKLRAMTHFSSSAAVPAPTSLMKFSKALASESSMLRIVRKTSTWAAACKPTARHFARRVRSSALVRLRRLFMRSIKRSDAFAARLLPDSELVLRIQKGPRRHTGAHRGAWWRSLTRAKPLPPSAAAGRAQEAAGGFLN